MKEEKTKITFTLDDINNVLKYVFVIEPNITNITLDAQSFFGQLILCKLGLIYKSFEYFIFNTVNKKDPLITGISVLGSRYLELDEKMHKGGACFDSDRSISKCFLLNAIRESIIFPKNTDIQAQYNQLIKELDEEDLHLALSFISPIQGQIRGKVEQIFHIKDKDILYETYDPSKDKESPFTRKIESITIPLKNVEFEFPTKEEIDSTFEQFINAYKTNQPYTWKPISTLKYEKEVAIKELQEQQKIQDEYNKILTKININIEYLIQTNANIGMLLQSEMEMKAKIEQLMKEDNRLNK